MALRKSFISSKTLVIPANASVTQDISGNVFQVYVSNGTFSLQMDKGEQLSITGLMGFKLLDNETFKKLTFGNTSGSDVTITYFVGALEAVFWVGK